MNDAFFTLHSGLAREGPGDRASLDRALAAVHLPPSGRVLDAGCGPGADIAGLMAHVPDGEVLAIDRHEPFVAAAAARFRGAPRARAMAGDMARPPGRFDLIWCAGALYFLGLRRGLALWRDHLSPGGAVAFTELAWRGPDRPAAAQAFWAGEYPAMTDAEGVAAEVAAAGYRIVARFFLPDAAWEAYFGPIEARVALLRPAAAHDPALAAVLAEAEVEIARWRADRHAMGYLQVVAVPR